MRKEKTLLFLGILTIILPALGLPQSWKQIISLLLGLAIIYIAYLYKYQKKLNLEKIENKVESFTDSKN